MVPITIPRSSKRHINDLQSGMVEGLQEGQEQGWMPGAIEKAMGDQEAMHAASLEKCLKYPYKPRQL